MMTHDEASELLGAYGLDAVDGDERTELEEHLETCPRCRAELDSLREVAAAMGNSVEPLPEGLWSHIAVRLPERHEDEEPPPMPRLTSESRSTFRAPDSGRRRPTRALVTTVGAIAVAAAAVAVVLGIGLVRADNTDSNLRSAQAGPSSDGDGRPAHARAPARHARLGLARGAGADGRGALGAGLPRLVEAAIPGSRPDLPAVGGRGQAADLPRPPRGFATPGRLHHGRLDTSFTAGHHGRAVGRVRRPHGPDHRGRDRLTSARSC